MLVKDVQIQTISNIQTDRKLNENRQTDKQTDRQIDRQSKRK